VVGTLYKDTSIYPVDSPYYPITALEEGRETDIYYARDIRRYIKGSASYFFDKAGRKIGYIIVTADVTEMVLERNVIDEQRSLLDKMFSASPDLIWYVDINGVYQAVNPRFASIVGAPVDAFKGKTNAEMLTGDGQDEFVQNDFRAIASPTPLYSERTIRFADGHEEVLESVRTPIRDSMGALVGMLGFARNVTGRVAIEQELRSAQSELEQAVYDANRANEHKSEFLARMSHEIRTPMNAIVGLTNIVERKLGEMTVGTGVSEIKDHVRQIEISSRHLLGLLNDILDLSKIEAGKIELTDDVLEISKLAHAVAGIIQPRCDEKNIAFVTEFDAFSPSTFTGDSLRLRQVLLNLLGNAVKFTPELGRIAFRIHMIDRADGATLVEFAVSDSGIGISEEQIRTIFMPFEQADSTITQHFGGTGLGLSISSRIVQLFGGEIAVKSRPGEGSIFTFRIWLKEAETQTPEEETAMEDIDDRFIGRHALLVDDVDINRMIVVSLLETTGIEIDEAEDGVKAVEAFGNSPEGYYDLIFMDVQMPNMDGYEATRAIRAMAREDAGRVPICALTANAFKEDIDKAIASGMNAHVTKPVDMDKMVEVLMRFLKHK
jgi:PAS domain S-box-containing protein